MMKEWNDGSALYHYGILGQKRGERRFQNPDGTYTEEGLKRKRATYETKSDNYVRDVKRTSDKDRRRMTDDELRQRADRLQLEKRVKDLEKEVNPRADQWAAEQLKKVAGKTIVQVGTSVAVAVGIAWLTGKLPKFSDVNTSWDAAEYVDKWLSVMADMVKLPTPKNPW